MPGTERRILPLAAGDSDVAAHQHRTSAAMAIAEAVWNSLDADASEVNIALHREVADGPVTRVKIADNGHGMPPEKLDAAFGTHRDSPKRLVRTSPSGRPMHGKNGRGRFRLFAIASAVHWDSVALNGIGEPTRISIDIKRGDCYKS